MEIITLTSKEFESFAKKNKYVTFHQKESWGKLKEKNGWKYYLLGMKDNNKIVAATLLLEKDLPLGLKMFYAPRGFLIDFHDYKLLDEFIEKLKDYLKKKGAAFLKIDPYVIHLERDTNGNIVEGGIDNTELVDHLKNIGFIHHGYNIDSSKELQPRWMFTLNLKDKSVDELMMNMIKPTRKNVKQTIKLGLTMEFIGEVVNESSSLHEQTAKSNVTNAMSKYLSLIYYDNAKFIRLLYDYRCLCLIYHG